MANPHKIYKRYTDENRITLYPGDCLKLLKSLNSESVQLIITSPPYNVGKEYEIKGDLGVYLDQQALVIEECRRVLSPNGSICWQTGNYILGSASVPKSVVPLDILYYGIFADYGFKLRNRIVWTFGHGLHTQYRLSGRYETIMWYTASDDYVFNLDEIRVKQKYPGKRAFRGDSKGKPSGNPLGKNPGDYWDDVGFEDHELIQKERLTDLWNNIPNVKGNHIEKTEHPCQFPVALARRLVKMLSNKNDLILDPYVGTGTSLIAGLLENRRVVGAEIEPAYVDITSDRLNSFHSNIIQFRPDKPLYKPDKKTRVAREPEEWLRQKES